jgi:GGDEF domain-containing protein
VYRQDSSHPVGGARGAVAASPAELAKGWLLALLDRAPLGAAPGIAAGGLSAEGPRVCEAVVAALESDAALDRLRPGGELEELVARTGELAGAPTLESSLAAVDALQATIWAAVRRRVATEDPYRVWGLGQRLAVVAEVLRDGVLRHHAASRWPAALEAAIVVAKRAGVPLSLLAVELADADLIGQVDRPEAAAVLRAQFRAAVRSALAPQDQAVEAGEARVWVIAPGRDRRQAKRCARAIDRAVQAMGPWRGASLAATVGVAVLREDGKRARSLVQAAERSGRRRRA